MNTRGVIRRLFPEKDFENFSYPHDSEPAYFGNLAFAWRVMTVVFRLTPASNRSVLLSFLRKRITGMIREKGVVGLISGHIF
jgi:hypothetical protein